jgi:hypothetical protein
MYFVMKLYMFRRVRLSIIRSLFTVHSAMVYFIQVCRQLSSRSLCLCRVSWQNKFVKLVHLFGFITNKFVTMRGHTDVKHKNSLHTWLFIKVGTVKYQPAIRQKKIDCNKMCTFNFTITHYFSNTVFLYIFLSSYSSPLTIIICTRKY